MGKSERLKGAAFERLIVRWFKEWGFPAERTLTETRDGNIGDVLVPVKLFKPLSRGAGDHRLLRIQAKHKKAPSIWKAMDEARTSAQSLSEITPAIVKRTNDQTVVVLTTADFMRLLLAATGDAPESSVAQLSL
jgi:hypothetical protein